MMCAERAASGKILGNIRHKWISFLFIPMAVMLFQEEPFAEYISCSYSNVENLCFGILYYAVSAVSIGLVLYISELISARKVGRYIAMAGRYSLEIYVMHMFAVKFIPIVPSLILENSVYEYLYFGCYGFVVTVLIVLFSENVLERYKLGRWMMGINGTACGK